MLVFNKSRLRVYPVSISVLGTVGPIVAYGSRGEIRTCLPVKMYVVNVQFIETNLIYFVILY